MGLSLPRRPVVLLVEDELLLRMDAAAMVAEAGFEVVEAGDADALEEAGDRDLDAATSALFLPTSRFRVRWTG